MPTLLDELDLLDSIKKPRTLLDEAADMETKRPVLSTPPSISAIPGNVEVQNTSQSGKPALSAWDKWANPRTMPERWLGTGETALSLGTGLVAAPLGAVAGIVKGLVGGKYGKPEGALDAAKTAEAVTDTLTYRPRSEMGQEYLSDFGKVFEESKLGGLGPTEAIALAGLKGARTVPKNGAVELQKQFNEKLTPKPVETVPAGTTPITPLSKTQAVPSLPDAVPLPTADEVKAMVQNASPELRQTLEQAATKGPVEIAAATRQLEADALPFPMKLTRGQALQDAAAISDEMNRRAKIPGMVEHLNQQNADLVKNLNAVRSQVAPALADKSPVESGRTLIAAYEALDEAKQADIRAKYKALADANGGDLPLDGTAFSTQSEAALKKQFKGRYLPAEIKGDLEEIASRGKMTFEEFENMRTTLASAARKAERAGDGNQAAAVSIVREVLENIPMTGETEQIKPLADAARSAAKARFDSIKSDPAYKAAVSGAVSPDDFVDRFVARGKVDNVKKMTESLAENPGAKQAIAAGAINHLKGKAGILADDTGNFAAKTFRTELQNMDPKLDFLVGPEAAKTMRTLGKVATYTTNQPKGSYVNNSNTLVGAIREGAVTAAEQGANMAAKGVPIGTGAKIFLKNRAAKKEAEQMLKPGAGTSISDFPK